MLAMVLDEPVAARAARAALDCGVIVNAIGDSVLRLLPALTITEAEVDEAVGRLHEAFAITRHGGWRVSATDERGGNGAAKRSRQRAIVELVRTRTIRTQEELVAALADRDLEATQATVSRDIRELGLLRVPGDGGPRYAQAGAEVDEQVARQRLHNALSEHTHGIEFVDLFGIVHAEPGTASLVAVAIDAARFDELAGTIAGDDTVLLIARSRPAAQRLLATLRTISEEFVVSARRLCVLAFSGGLDTSVAVRWLQEELGYDVVTLTADLGGEGRDADDVTARALRAGAVAAHVVDARRVFVEHFVFPTLSAGALYEGVYPLATALARPLIAKLLVEVAREEGAVAVAHGCTGKGNDQVRFDVATAALAPELAVVAPVRDWDMGRSDEIAYAAAHGIDVPATVELPYSVDANLWGRSVECGPLEDPWREPPEEVFAWTADPAALRPRRRGGDRGLRRGRPRQHRR